MSRCGTASYQTNLLATALSQNGMIAVALSQNKQLQNTPAATRGSAGIDLILQEEVKFKFPGEVQVVPSQLSGRLPQNYVGLVLPRCSMGKKGIFVIPGVIDSDYTGIIYVQLWTNFPQILSIHSSPAQLLHLPYFVLAGGKPKERGEGGFGPSFCIRYSCQPLGGDLLSKLGATLTLED
uniref:dUTPase-like domain-containing protein n=1 Tax=Naja naja TaxID=35670 RepID=A0A8C6XJH8_NAJNA